MSTERDIERILDAWLAPGPNEMPDRLYVDILDRIERTPQRRYAWTRTRFTSMFSPLKLPLAAGLAALILGLVAIPVLIGGPEVAVPGAATDATPSSGATASPSPRPTVPPQLQSSWSGAPKEVEGLGTASTLAQWTLGRYNFNLDYQDAQMNAAATAAGPDQFRLETVTGVPCERGDVGTYQWHLSEDGLGIDLTAIEDDCAPRAAFLTGHWTNTGCDLGVSCVGVLEAGRHGSALLDPRGAPDDAPVARPGGLTYELPEGWANAWDWLSSTTLVPTEAYERKLADQGIWTDQISVWARPAATTQAEPDCLLREDPAGGATIDSLAAWLTGHPSLVASEPVAVEIDGHAGLIIDIDMDPAAANVCPAAYDGFPAVPLFANGFGIEDDGMLQDWNSGGWEVDAWDFASGGICSDCTSDPQRLILLDLDGNPLVILIDTEEPEDQAAFVERAMPIVESFTFPE